MAGKPMAKDRPTIVVDVPPEFAAEFLTEHMRTRLVDRPLLPLRLGDTDLGMWQVMSVATQYSSAGYAVVTATLRAVWE